MPKATVRSVKLELPASWLVAGAKPQKYDGGFDPAEQREGERCMLLKNKEGVDPAGTWSTLMTSTKPTDFQGKRVRLTMHIKTENVSWAAPWMRVDKDDEMPSFDNGCQRQIYGSADWQEWTIVLNVPAGSSNIAYGVMLGGSGKVWMDMPVLEAVSEEVAVTDCACQRRTQVAADKKKAKQNARGNSDKLLLPKGWALRWVNPYNAAFDIGIDPKQSFSGQKAGCVSVKNALDYEAVELSQTMSCDGLRGKRIRLAVHLKSQAVEKGTFRLEVRGPHEGVVALDNMSNRPLQGTHDWAHESLVLDVPPDAVEMCFGARVTDNGTIWFSGLSLEEVDDSVAITDDYSHGCRGVWWSAPINTDFSKEEEARYRGQSCALGKTAKGWLGLSDPERMFEVGIDSSIRRNGKNSASIKKLNGGTASDHADLIQKFDGKVYRGKRVRLTAFVKTQAVVGQCGLSLHVMDPEQRVLFAANTFDIDSDVEHDWLKREIVMDIPVKAGVLMIMLELTGMGSVWINDVAFEVVDVDVPLTVSNWKAKPRNLDLSEVHSR